MKQSGLRELEAAEREHDPMVRRLWLVAAIQAIVPRPVFLVGGSAVDLHTGSYRPTDIDLVGAVGVADRVALIDAGFVESGGRHVKWVFSDGSAELVEFPESRLDGTFERITLSEDTAINVITVESLIVDRINQATDGMSVTFDEAVRLVIAVGDRVDWAAIASELAGRPDAIYLGSIGRARDVLVGAEMEHVSEAHFRE
ncbi:MAG: hypothetical protein M3092_08255 [Actinomycetia bacterium]|nr:hypothetical protein [Actinomycetes bacterium]